MQASADSNKTCNCFNITQPIFQSIDAFDTNFQLILIVDLFQLKQELVDFSSSNAFSIANFGLVSEGAQRRFVSSTIYSKSFELIDVSVPNKNKMCDASQLAANEHKCFNKSNTSVFQLKQELVDFSPSNSFSIATKLDSSLTISSVNAKANSAKLNETPTSQRKAMVYFYDGSSQFIVRYIYSSDSEGAHTAISCNETTFRALEIICVSTSFANFQLIVDLFLIQNREGAREVPITHYSASEGDRSRSLSSASDKSITFSLKNIHVQRLIVEFIEADIKNVHGSRALPTTLPMLNNRNSKFIVASHYSKTFRHFSKGFAIFCEGDQENTNNGNGTEDTEVVVPQKSNLPSLLSLASAISTQAELDALASLDFSGISGLVNQISIISLIGIGDLSLNSLVGSSASFACQLIGNIGLGVSFIGLGFVGLVCLGFFSLGGLIDHNGLVGRSDLVDHIGLRFIGHNGLVSFIGLGIVSFIGLSLDSLGRLLGHISLIGRCIIGLIELAALSNHWPISLIGVIGIYLIASLASAASLARRLISFVGLIGSSTHQLFCECLATAVNEATKITSRLKQVAALGVATLRSSATETAASTYSFTISSLNMHSLVREKIWWWLALARKKMWWWIASFGESYSGDVLQYAKHLFAKQLFSLRLPQMTKYCVMRECDNIHPWISTTGDLAFSHQQEFTVLNSQKGFRRSLPEISLFSLSSHLY
jgi:hypothetical protein